MSDNHHEIVIIKRHHGDHDDHHGGVWKIAFADFMTAMMAFFLVMWLIAANDKTRATVARYFNPVKLVDATVRKQGLHDPKVDDATAASPRDSTDGRSTEKDKQPGNPPPNETPKEREARLDATMRSNPLAALAEIAEPRKAGEGPPTDALNGAAPVIGHAGGTAFRDPFAPPPTQPTDVDDKDVDPMDVLPPKSTPRSINPATRRAEKPSPDQKADDQAEEKGDAPHPQPPKSDATKAQREDADLTKLIASLKTPGHDADGPDIKVRRTGEGYLVSLTDTEAFSMFANGSAVPSRRVVQMMERIAKALAAKKGGVIVRGFTDNKPFRSGRYDNWNLSVDRAQAAHYMLVRGGLSDERIAGVQGFADHGASPGVDPASPLNRRIEILLKDEPQ